MYILTKISLTSLILVIIFVMKKGKQNNKSGANFFKYTTNGLICSSRPSKTHSKSVVELQQPFRYERASKNIQNIQANSSSVSVQRDSAKKGESNSLKKFLSMFGGVDVLNSNPISRGSIRDSKPSYKSDKQVFTCNIKNMNVNVSHSKEPIEKHTLKVKKQQQNIKQQHSLEQKRIQSNQGITKQKQVSFHNESIVKQNQQLRSQNKKLRQQVIQLKRQIKSIMDQREIFQQRSVCRQKQLEKTIKELQKSLALKQRCRQHELIIESLKKVLNEQLHKIIQLQKSKIERQEIEKLQQKINSNLLSSKKSFNLSQNPLISFRRRDNHIIYDDDQQCLSDRVVKISNGLSEGIRIQDDNFPSSLVSMVESENVIEGTIQEATEEEENYESREGSEKKREQILMRKSEERTEENDQILQEVDLYLSKWRNRL